MHRLTIVFLCLLLVFALAAAQAAAQDEGEGSKKFDRSMQQTVTIRVTDSGGDVEHGSGVVLCQQPTERGNEVFVLTAHHVLAGKNKSGSGKNPLRMRRLSAVEISFYGSSPPSVGKDSLIVRQVPDEDLLLLSFPVRGSALESATLDSAVLPDEETVEDDWPAVHSIGYWKKEAKAWQPRPGALRPGAGRLIHHTGDVAEGFSGGPLFNEAGSLIGINIERVRGNEIGADERWYGEALEMDHILPLIHKWVPAVCVKSVSPLSEVAHLTYRDAMRAVSIKRWPEAEKLLAEAIKQQPVVQGSVHLEGLRYTPYLPYFYAGLASYKLAGKAGEDPIERYSEAIRYWDRSESAREIQNNKRYKSLQRLRAKSYRQLRELRTSGDAS